MSETTTGPELTDDVSFRDVLRVVLDAGTQIIQDLAACPDTKPAAKAEPFERIARAIRRTIVLARHIAENPAQRSASPASRRTDARRRVIREVEEAIANVTEHPERVESLRAELDETLDDPEFDAQIATRPIAEIIQDLKYDLGLDERPYSPRHPRRTPADIRTLNTRAAAPSGSNHLEDDRDDDPIPIRRQH